MLVTGLDEDIAQGLLKIHEVTLWDLLSQDPKTTRQQLAKFGTRSNHVEATIHWLDQLNNAYHQLLIEHGDEAPISPISAPSVPPNAQVLTHQQTPELRPSDSNMSSSGLCQGRPSSSSLPEETGSLSTPSGNSLDALASATQTLYQHHSDLCQGSRSKCSSTTFNTFRQTPLSPQVSSSAASVVLGSSNSANSRRKSPGTPPPKTKLKLAPDMYPLHKSKSQVGNFFVFALLICRVVLIS